MSSNFVITIGREYGSGGREIGRELAHRLGVKCYDKELLSMAAEESGLSEEFLREQDEKTSNSFRYTLVMESYSMGYSTSSFLDMPLNHKVFMAQYEAIKKIADNESCVIVGRCADYALQDMPNRCSVFIKASMDARVNRIRRLYDYSESKAKDVIIKTDKKRANYYNFYSNKKWADSRSYDLCVDSSELGIDNTVELILKYVELKTGAKPKKDI